MRAVPAVLTAGWILPGPGRAPVRNGQVVVSEGRVVEVRPGTQAGPPGPLRGLPVTDLGDGVLLPGLVNAHCHLELSHLADQVHSSGDYVAWVEELVTARFSEAAPDASSGRARGGGLEVGRQACAEAIDDLVAAGTVAVADVSNRLAHLDLLGASRLEAVVLYELLGWDPAAAGPVLAAADARLAEVGAPRPFPNVEIRLAAHAPHSVSPALFAAQVARGGPAALHLAESLCELRFLQDGDAAWSGFLARRGLGHVAFAPPHLSPVQYVEALGALRPSGAPLIAAHCVQVDAEDCTRLAESGAFVALCPRSNQRLGVGLPPLSTLLAAGVRLCLGSDSLASAPSLDVLEDAAALHRGFPDGDPRLLVEMATSGGAAALGLRHLGTLDPGKKALFAYAPSDGPVEDPYAFLVQGGVRTWRVSP